ncbi:ACT domain-containing protein, partial [Pseudomonas amygdali pv. mori str. 301020]
WLESRMSRMAGQFAGILKVGVEPEKYDDLIKALNALSAHGIRMLLAESVIETTAPTQLISMQLVGNDRPGIVRDITRLLAGQGNHVLTGQFTAAVVDSSDIDIEGLGCADETVLTVVQRVAA